MLSSVRANEVSGAAFPADVEALLRMAWSLY